MLLESLWLHDIDFVPIFSYFLSILDDFSMILELLVVFWGMFWDSFGMVWDVHKRLKKQEGLKDLLR